MKKKDKAGRGQKPAAKATLDPVLVVQKAEAALARREIDLACQLLAPFKPAPGSPVCELAARAFLSQAFTRWDRPARAIESLDRALEWAPGRADLHRLRGNLLRRLGRLKSAVAALAEAERLAPQEPGIAFESALARLAAGESAQVQPDSAAARSPALASRAAALQAAMRGDPSAAEAAVAAAPAPLDRLMDAVLLIVLQQKDRAAGAVSALEAVAASAELSPIAKGYALFYLGVARAHRRELVAAAQAFEAALALNISFDEVRVYLSWVYQQLATDAVLGGDLAQAAEWFGTLERLGGPEAAMAKENAAHALSLHGQRLAQEGNSAGAIEAWTQALALSPHDADLRQNLAILLEREERTDEAIPHWQELIRQMADEAKGKGRRRADSQREAEEESLSTHRRALAHRHLADLYLEQREWGRAVEQMERALRVLPSDADTHRDLARLLVDDGQIRKALPHFEQVVAAGGSAADNTELGLAYLVVGQDQAGMEQLEKAFALAPEDQMVRISLGTALVNRARRFPAAPTARADAERAEALLPERYVSRALLALAAVLLAAGDNKKAKQTLARAAKQSEDKASASLEIGHIYWKAGDREAAVKALMGAMKKAKRNPCLYAELAVAWARVGDRERCRESLLKSLEHSAEEAVAAMETMGKAREEQPLLREVLNSIIEDTEDLVERVYLAEGLVYAGDLPGARSLLRNVARQAVEEDDLYAIDAISEVDMKFNHSLLDHKALLVLLDWLDAHPGLMGRYGI